MFFSKLNYLLNTPKEELFKIFDNCQKDQQELNQIKNELLPFGMKQIFLNNNDEGILILGVLIYQMILISQDKEIQNLSKLYSQIQFEFAQNKSFIDLALEIMELNANNFPSTTEFEILFKKLKLNVHYWKHFLGKDDTIKTFSNGQQISNEQINIEYFFILYQTESKQIYFIVTSKFNISSYLSFKQPSFKSPSFIQKTQSNFGQQNNFDNNSPTKFNNFQFNNQFTAQIKPQPTLKFKTSNDLPQQQQNTNQNGKIKILSRTICSNPENQNEEHQQQEDNQFNEQQIQSNIIIMPSSQTTTQIKILHSVIEEDVLQTNQFENQIEIQQPPEIQRVLPRLVHQDSLIGNCIICQEEYKINDFQDSIMPPCCNQKLHRDCLTADTSYKADNNRKFDGITCFNCNKIFDQSFLKRILSSEALINIYKTQALQNIASFCFNCNCPIQIANVNNQTKYQCLQCQTYICTLCRKAYHGENQQNQQCPSIRNEILQSLKGMPITICPNCDLIQTKDERCNHVVCSNCKTSLCFVCSVDRTPILAHGNHYHRKGCSDYHPFLDKQNKPYPPEFKPEKCQICKKNKKACQFPISLQEYKKLKQY